MRLTARWLIAYVVVLILASLEKAGTSGAVLQAAGDSLQSLPAEASTRTATATSTVTATATPTDTLTPTSTDTPVLPTATIPEHPTATRQYTNTPLPTDTPLPPSATPPPPVASATPSPLPRPVVATPTGQVPANPLPGSSFQSPIATPPEPPAAPTAPEPVTETPTPTSTSTEDSGTPVSLPSATLQPVIFSSVPGGKATRVPADAPSTYPLSPALPASRLVLWISAASLAMAALLGIGVALWRARRP